MRFKLKTRIPTFRIAVHHQNFRISLIKPSAISLLPCYSTSLLPVTQPHPRLGRLTSGWQPLRGCFTVFSQRASSRRVIATILSNFVVLKMLHATAIYLFCASQNVLLGKIIQRFERDLIYKEQIRGDAVRQGEAATRRDATR